MKKLLIACSVVLLSLSASAQVHFGIGAGVGTTGVDIDASFMFGKYIGLRGGVDICPDIKVNKDLDLGISDKTAGHTVAEMSQYIDKLNNQIDVWNATHPTDKMERIDKSLLPNQEFPNKMEVEGKWKNTTGHVLIDLYPGGGSFHFTFGAYFGKDEIVSVYNKEDGFFTPINQWNNAIITAQENPASTLNTLVVKPYNLSMIGGDLGDYFVTPNPAENGNVKAYAQVKKFRPYVGLGFGRAVPKKRIGMQLDLGVQFWGKPEIFVPTYDKTSKTYQYEKIEGDRAGEDVGEVLKTISKVSVYPVINLRLVGRLF